MINFVRRSLISDAEAEHELKRLQIEVSQMQEERDELSRGQETAEELELRILNAETRGMRPTRHFTSSAKGSASSSSW